MGNVLAEKGIRALTSPDQEARGASVDEVMRRSAGALRRCRRIWTRFSPSCGHFPSRRARSWRVEQIVRTRLAQLHVVDSFAQSELMAWCMAGRRRNPLTASGALNAKFGDKVLVGKLDRTMWITSASPRNSEPPDCPALRAHHEAHEARDLGSSIRPGWWRFPSSFSTASCWATRATASSS